MEEDREQFFNEQDSIKKVERYENMRQNKSNCFFDVHEFEEIIDYYLGSRKLDRALEVARYSISQHPDSSGLKLKYSQVLIDKENPESALKVLSKIEKIEEYNYEFFLLQGMAFFNLGNKDAAFNSFELAIEKSINDKREVLRDIAQIYLNKNEHEQALIYLTQLYNLDQKDINTVYDIAACYNILGRETNSIKLYKKYLDHDPFADGIWFNLGILYFQLEEYEKAVEAFDFSLVISDEFVSTYYYKAISQMNLGKYEDAIITYKEYIEEDEETEEVFCFIAECYERLKDFTKANDYYLRSIKINDEFPDAWFGLALVNKEQKKYDEAIQNIIKAISLDVDNGDFWYTLGELYNIRGNNVKALKALRKAFEYDPQDFDSWMLYSDILSREGKIDTAIGILKESYQFNYDISLINYRLAALYFIKKDKQKVLHYLECGLMLNYIDHREMFEYVPDAKKDKDIKKLINLYKKSSDEF